MQATRLRARGAAERNQAWRAVGPFCELAFATRLPKTLYVAARAHLLRRRHPEIVGSWQQCWLQAFPPPWPAMSPFVPLIRPALPFAVWLSPPASAQRHCLASRNGPTCQPTRREAKGKASRKPDALCRWHGGHVWHVSLCGSRLPILRPGFSSQMAVAVG